VNLHKKLIKIDEEINSGLKLKAADRLRNLINEYPNDLSLWNKLAELYYQSGFLDAAGRYWILFEPTDDRIKESIEAYKKSVNNSGYQILQEITFRGEKKKLPEYAQKKLEELETDSRKKAQHVPRFTKKLNRKERKEQPPQSFRDKVIEKLLIGGVIAIPILAIIGLIRVFQWLF